MNKYKAFTLSEIFVVLALIIATAAFVIPNLLEDNKKLDTIAKWKNTYQNITYVFSVLHVQASQVDNMAFEKASTDKEKEKVLYELLMPYLRMEKEVSNNDYKTYYLNGDLIKDDDYYYITNLHSTNSGKVIGLKWLNTPETIQDKFPIALMAIDLNGVKKPNRWGYDIFGINIYTNKIEPLGKSDDDYYIKSDCTKKGKGISCSYYYYIYGGQLN
ncbi:type II secretion system protein [bacterium]|nr:type II secretion system protein [bacterium]